MHEAVFYYPLLWLIHLSLQLAARHESPISDLLMDSINEKQSYEGQHWQGLHHTPCSVLRLFLYSLICTKPSEKDSIASIFKMTKLRLRKVKVRCPRSQLKNGRSKCWRRQCNPESYAVWLPEWNPNDQLEKRPAQRIFSPGSHLLFEGLFLFPG